MSAGVFMICGFCEKESSVNNGAVFCRNCGAVLHSKSIQSLRVMAQ